MNELVKFDGKKSVGIKEVKVIRRVSPESFTKCGTFSRRDIKKEYRPGRGIVQSVIDTIVYFDCLHQATPESLGGMCWLETVVCKQCLIMCAEPGCGRDVCRASHCNCGGMRDGRVYCTKHLNTGIRGFLSVLFE
jgi:hypothetical protein